MDKKKSDMHILNFGSLNIDHVYRVDHFVRPGETLASLDYQRFCGGKGNNQSIALARAGAQVWHAGKVGRDGAWLKENLADAGAHTEWVQVTDDPTGHAIIQVDAQGENCIVLFGGANHCITPADAAAALAPFGKGDWLLLQNEISAIPDILRIASERGLSIAFNPAPMDAAVGAYPLDSIDLFIINAIEGQQLTQQDTPDAILSAMRARFPGADVILTLGSRGAIHAGRAGRVDVPAEPVTPVDTTAAGDTFIGYFLADFCEHGDPEPALRSACKAAALCVTRPGAADSIPMRAEVKTR